MRLARGTLVTTVLFLCLLSIGGAAMRAVDAARIAINGAPTQALSPLDAMSFGEAVRAFNLSPGTRQYDRLHAMHANISRKFWSQPAMTLLHALSGIVILTLGPLQLWPRFRARHPLVHRWSGRSLLVAAVALALTGFWFGLLAPTGGTGEALAVAVFGGFFVFAACRAWRHIRRGEVARHREWMVRMFAIALGAPTMRVVSFVTLVVMDGGAEMVNPRSAGMLFWIGWLLNLAVAELWIRRSRAPVRA